MKKVVSLLAVLFLFAGLASAVTYSTNTYTGIADFTNSGTIDFSFTLKNVIDDGAASQLAWTSSDAFVTSSTTVKWVRADQYAEVKANITKAGFNVYMYQTNTKSTNYKAETPRTNADKSKVYSGLVNKDLKGGENKGYIPVAFSLVGKKNKNITYDQATSTTSATRSDKFFTDFADKKENGSSNFDLTYTKIAGLVGPVFGQGEYGDWTGSEVVDNTAYMYFFGGFSKIRGGDVYGTDQLHVIQVTE